jgi:AraC family transcriptional regulator, regulatory protein of adaptative response / methylated-DNA-[protein]-cysteine methyltransferase
METATDIHLDSDPEAAWAAVLARDARLDGRFVYAVASTGVYCRPSCPSRRPRREQVRFFAAPGAAEAAGYRACRRCRPASGEAPRATRAVAAARVYLEEHLDETVTLEHLGRVAGMSPTHLQRTFRRLTGASPKEYVQARRAERLKARLRKGDNVTTATYEAGYGAASRLYEQAGARLGMTPATYRRGGRGMHIRYTVVPSPLGRLLVAATERGVCAVQLGDAEEPLAAALRREYPHATLERAGDSGNGLGAWVAAIVRHLEGSPAALAVPLDLQATAFQLRVWKALQEIPAGATRSYGEVAAALGRPGAARAVARACAGNPVALVVPCHRVVQADGEPGGYRWGAERKRRLLDRERAPGAALADRKQQGLVKVGSLAG